MLMTAGFLEHHQDIQYRMLGMTAYKDGRFDDALRFFRRAAFFADKPSQGMVAEMYWNGQGVPRDPVQAYIWMDLAAERGYLGFLSVSYTHLDVYKRQVVGHAQQLQRLFQRPRLVVAAEQDAELAPFGLSLIHI